MRLASTAKVLAKQVLKLLRNLMVHGAGQKADSRLCSSPQARRMVHLHGKSKVPGPRSSDLRLPACGKRRHSHSMGHANRNVQLECGGRSKLQGLHC